MKFSLWKSSEPRWVDPWEEERRQQRAKDRWQIATTCFLGTAPIAVTVLLIACAPSKAPTSSAEPRDAVADGDVEVIMADGHRFLRHFSRRSLMIHSPACQCKQQAGQE